MDVLTETTMKNLTTRALVVASLFAGAAFGSLSTGCFALWLGVAHASNGTPAAGVVVDVPCAGAVKGSDGNLYAVAPFPGSAKEDLAANVSIVQPNGDPAGSVPSITIGGVTYMPGGYLLSGPPRVADGAALVGCAAGAASVSLYVRQ